MFKIKESWGESSISDETREIIYGGVKEFALHIASPSSVNSIALVPLLRVLLNTDRPNTSPPQQNEFHVY